MRLGEREQQSRRTFGKMLSAPGFIDRITDVPGVTDQAFVIPDAQANRANLFAPNEHIEA